MQGMQEGFSYFVMMQCSFFLLLMLARMKLSLSSANTEKDASVTIFIALSTACMWQSNEGMQEGFSLFVMM